MAGWGLNKSFEIFSLFVIFKELISFHMITQSVCYRNVSVKSKLKYIHYILTIGTSKKKKH